MAEFKGQTLATLDSIHRQITSIKTEGDKKIAVVAKEVNGNDERIKDLEMFQANMVGKFAVIGAVIMMVTNFFWDMASNFVSKNIK